MFVKLRRSLVADHLLIMETDFKGSSECIICGWCLVQYVQFILEQETYRQFSWVSVFEYCRAEPIWYFFRAEWTGKNEWSKVAQRLKPWNSSRTWITRKNRSHFQNSNSDKQNLCVDQLKPIRDFISSFQIRFENKDWNEIHILICVIRQVCRLVLRRSSKIWWTFPFDATSSIWMIHCS